MRSFVAAIFLASSIWGQVHAQNQQQAADPSAQRFQQAVARTDYQARSIGPDRLAELSGQAGVVVLDLRSKGEFNAAHFKNAQWLGADINEKRLAELIPTKDTTVVLYCSNSFGITRTVSLTTCSLPQFLLLGYSETYVLKDAFRQTAEERKTIRAMLIPPPSEP